MNQRCGGGDDDDECKPSNKRKTAMESETLC